MRYHYLSIRMDKIQNTDIATPNADKDMKQQELSFIVCVTANWHIYSEDSLALSYNAEIILQYDSAIVT